MEKIMSKSSRTTPTTNAVRELRDDELESVSGGYVYDSTYVMGIVAAQTNGAFRGRYQLRLDEANSLLSTQH